MVVKRRVFRSLSLVTADQEIKKKFIKVKIFFN